MSGLSGLPWTGVQVSRWGPRDARHGRARQVAGGGGKTMELETTSPPCLAGAHCPLSPPHLQLCAGPVVPLLTHTVSCMSPSFSLSSSFSQFCLSHSPIFLIHRLCLFLHPLSLSLSLLSFLYLSIMCRSFLFLFILLSYSPSLLFLCKDFNIASVVLRLHSASAWYGKKTEP